MQRISYACRGDAGGALSRSGGAAWRLGRRWLASCAAIIVAVLFFASAAAAMTVSTTGDAGGCSLREAIVAVNTGNSGGPCGAVVSGGTTTIAVPAGHYTLTAGELQIGASAHLSIVGADESAPVQTTIDAASASRVLEVMAGAQATLTGVELTGGQTASGANGVEPLHPGGLGGNGGGILNHGALTLSHVLVKGDKTGLGGKGADGNASATAARNPASGGEGGSGGGIYNDQGASLTVTASTITENVTGDGGAGGNAAMGVQGLGNISSGADGGNGAYSGSGGGIYNAGTLTIATTTVSANSTGRGGAGGSGGQGAGESEHSPAGEGGEGGSGGNGGLLYGESGFPQYAAFLGGGGIYNGGTLAMTASTLSGNNTGAGGNGGGAGIGGERENGTFEDARHGGDAGSGGLGGGLLNLGTGATLTNVTVAGNRTGDGGTGGATAQSGSLGGGLGGFGGYGGGIWARGTNTSDIVQLTDVTIAGNFVGALGVGGAERISGERGLGAGIATGPQSTDSGNSVILKNTLVASNGLPLSGDQNCVQKVAGDIHDGGHDISFPDASCPGANGDPLLGTLGENGGPTKTLLPGAGSSAIEAVPPGSCEASEDQRGFSRPGGGKSACDVGAVETGPPPAPPVIVLDVGKFGHGAGTVTSSPAGINCGVDCGEEFEAGKEVTLTATPSAGSTFSGWTGGGCSGTGTCKVTMSASMTVFATFSLPSKLLTVVKAGAGSGTVTSGPGGISCGATCAADFETGETVTLSATSANGSTFTGWSGGGCSGTGNCQVTIGATATSVTATFTVEPTSPGGGGGGAGSSGGSAPSPTPTPTPAPAPKPELKPLKCKKGFVKKAVKGKPTCVKAKHRRHHHH
jgi:Divergent InlB B-repeat domain